MNLNELYDQSHFDYVEWKPKSPNEIRSTL